MNYTNNNDHFRNLVDNQLMLVNNRIPVYPGVGASAPGLPPDQVAFQIHQARASGVKGFIIFNYDLPVVREILPALSKGVMKGL